MKQKLLIVLAAVIASISVFSQTENNKSEIIIQKQGERREKMNITIDGDKVMINGKDISAMTETELKDLHLSGKNLKFPKGNMRIFGDDKMMNNKARLGVITEKANEGVKISEVSKESAAARAGLKSNDIITKVDQTIIDSPEKLSETIRSHQPSDKVSITYMREGKTNTTSATLDKIVNEEMVFNFDSDMLPRLDNLKEFKMEGFPDGMKFLRKNPSKLGLQVQDTEDGKGIKVLDTIELLAAAKAGIKKGDIITAFDGKTIASVDELKEKTNDLKDGDTFKLTIERNGKPQVIEVKIPRKLKTANL